MTFIKVASVKKNFILQSLYQIIILFIPLILSPYLTRKLGAEALGIFTYTNSIAYYFLLFCSLGILKHGQRAIAAVRNDEVQLRKTFWSLFYIHIIVSVFVTLIYLFCCFFVFKIYQQVYLVQTLYVIAAIFDITWLFYGLENFKSVLIKNLCVKITEVILIFLFVKTPNDLLIYTTIFCCGLVVGNAIMIPQAIKMIPYCNITYNDMKHHIKPLLILFVAVIATNLYTVFDKTLIGILSSNMSDVAYYEYSSKIIQVPRSIIAVIATVLMPRACVAYANSDFKSQKKYLHYSIIFTSILGFACVTGLIAISDKLAIVYYGNEFIVCGKFIAYLSPLIVIVYIGEMLRSIYMIPINKDSLYVKGVCVSAVINVIVSTLLIPKIGVYGAIFGTTLAETFNLLFVIYVCREFYSSYELIRDSVPFILPSIVMGIFVHFVDSILPNSPVSLLIEIIVGGIVYTILTTIVIYKFYPTLFLKLKKSVSNILRIKK